MSRIAALILMSLSIFWGTAQADDQLQLNTTACNEMNNADAALNQVYKKVLAKYQDDEIFINKFVAAQKKWIEFRDAYVDSMYIPENRDSYGTVFPMCQCYFLEKIIDERVKQLQVWLDGIPEGDVCIGSVK